jgi:GNAT superfamily N-acetyltransferase
MSGLKDVRFEVFEVDRFTQAQWEEVARYHNEVQSWLDPELPGKSVEAVNQIYAVKDPRRDVFRVMAWGDSGERMFGAGGLYVSSVSDPAYEDNRHIGTVRITVRELYRRRKVATNILGQLARRAKELGVVTLQGSADLESGKAFCVKFGAKVAGRAFLSRLKIEDVDFDMIDQWRREGEKRAVGVVLERYSTIPEEYIDEFISLMTELIDLEREIARGSGDEGSVEGRFVLDAESYYHRVRESIKRGEETVILLSRELDGRFSGMTLVDYNRETEPGRVWQGLSGVRKAYQGRGIGKWLKAEMIAYLREHYPGMTEIDTGNATTNAPMLSINRRLGFQTVRDNVTFKIGVDELLERLEFFCPV